MKGYLNNHKATEEIIDADGFLHTGDVGYYNENRQLFYIDRIKELIKVKGFQVSTLKILGQQLYRTFTRQIYPPVILNWLIGFLITSITVVTYSMRLKPNPPN